jgi:hypothetical protein
MVRVEVVIQIHKDMDVRRRINVLSLMMRVPAVLMVLRFQMVRGVVSRIIIHVDQGALHQENVV